MAEFVDDKYVKILFKFYSQILDEETIETMWAEIIDEEKGHYKLDSIPFYAPLVASEDIVFAKFDEVEQSLVYQHTITHSGNSTVQVVVIDAKSDTDGVREQFTIFGCQSEAVNDQYFSMDIPSFVNYQPIKQKLEELEAQEIIVYAEPCLSVVHQQN
ncbi:MAG: DUF4265 domain-containing protein [Bacteroidetes bacterium]|nr:DUF4265 domain-containing protein [Bacteroidota bacterium]